MPPGTVMLGDGLGDGLGPPDPGTEDVPLHPPEASTASTASTAAATVARGI
jgi:hypothetical protein